MPSAFYCRLVIEKCVQAINAWCPVALHQEAILNEFGFDAARMQSIKTCRLIEMKLKKLSIGKQDVENKESNS